MFVDRAALASKSMHLHARTCPCFCYSHMTLDQGFNAIPWSNPHWAG